MQEFITAAIQAGTFPGAGLIVARVDDLLFEEYWGSYCSPQERALPLESEVRHILYSFSKGVSATVIALAHQQGLVDYDAPLKTYIPEYHGKWKDETTLRHLLTHSAGLVNCPFGAAYSPEEWQGCIQACCEYPSEWQPGSQTAYHWAAGVLLAAEAVRRNIGLASWEEVCRALLFDPIGAEGLTFRIPSGAPVALTPQPAELPCPLDTAHFNALGHPGAGCFGRPRDALRVIQLLLNGGRWRGQVLLQPTELAELLRIQYEGQITAAQAGGRAPQHEPWGLGWLVRRDLRDHWFGLGSRTSSRAFGHAGIDTVLSVGDPSSGIGLVFITTHSPNPSAENTTRIRNTVTDLVFQACPPS